MVRNVEAFLLVLIENVFGSLGNMDGASLAEFLKFVRHHHVRAIDVISHDFCADDPSDDGASVDSNAHVKLTEVKFFSNPLNGLHHCQPHIHHILRLLQIISLVTVCESQHYIAIPYRVYFVHVVLETKFVEIFEQLSEHLDNSYGRTLVGE